MRSPWWLAVSLAVAMPAAQAVETIQVANWFEYINPEVIRNFTEETGIRVNYQTYEDDVEVYDQLKAGTSLDVAVPSTALFGRMLQEQMLQPLDVSKAVIDDQDAVAMLRLRVHDSKTRYAMPYLWGNVGIAVNMKQAEAALGEPVPHSWSLLFDKPTLEKLQSCGVGLLDVPGSAMAALFYYQGVSQAYASSGDVERAIEYLGTLWPHYRYVESTQYPADMRDNLLCVSMAWEGDANAISAANPDVQFLLPEEGNDLTMDVLVIPQTASNPEAARKFINYLLRPEVMASNVEYTLFHTTSKKASQLLQEAGLQVDNRMGHLSDKTPPLHIQAQIEQAWSQLKQH